MLNLHRGFGEDGSMVGKLWHHHGGDGMHRGILDSALRCAGTPPTQALLGGRPGYEECTGTAHGLARMPVVAVSAFGRTAASGVSTGWGSLRGAVVDAAPQ